MRHWWYGWIVGLGLVATSHAEEVIKVGVVLPFSGVYASLGGDITDGVQLAFEIYGSEIAGKKIMLITEDSEVKPSVGLTKTKKLVFQDKVDLLVGPVASNVAGAMRDFVHTAKIPLIIPNAGNNLLTGEKCSPWVIRTSFSNDQINGVMGPWLYAQGHRTLYLMAADYAAGRQMMDAVRRGFVGAGGEIVGEEYWPGRRTYIEDRTWSKRVVDTRLNDLYNARDGNIQVLLAGAFGGRRSFVNMGPRSYSGKVGDPSTKPSATRWRHDR